jgi:transmembrane sensor
MPSSTKGVGPGEAAAPARVEPSELSDQHRAPRARRKGWRLPALAASLALAIAVGGAWYFHSQGCVYRTPIGGLEAVPMADGSRVTLNTDSAIRVTVTPNERGIELERGEAFFEVAHDPSRPFIVSAGDQRMVAVGTQFSVRRNGDDVEVIVTEGTVRLESADGRHGLQGDRKQTLSDRSSSGPSFSSSGAGIDRSSIGSAGVVLLPAGSVAHASDADVLVQEESPAEVEQALSWRQGILVFHDMTLADAIAEFNRYNTRQIVIEDPTVAGLRIAGNFRATNVDAFVRLLEHGYPLRVEQDDSQVVLKAR